MTPALAFDPWQFLKSELSEDPPPNPANPPNPPPGLPRRLGELGALGGGHHSERKNEVEGVTVKEAELAGLRRAALQRPPSWTDPAAAPWPGCWCSCCHLGRWWTEAAEPRGWRCWTCHPPPVGNLAVEIAT